MPPGGEALDCADPKLEALGSWFPAEDLAAALGMTLKVVPGEGPVVLCRADTCVPIAIDGEKARREGERVLIEVGAAAAELGLRGRVDHTARVLVLEGDPTGGPRRSPPSVEVGRAAPDLDLPLLDGGRARLSSFRGRRVLVQAWASW